MGRRQDRERIERGRDVDSDTTRETQGYKQKQTEYPKACFGRGGTRPLYRIMYVRFRIPGPSFWSELRVGSYSSILVRGCSCGNFTCRDPLDQPLSLFSGPSLSSR